MVRAFHNLSWNETAPRRPCQSHQCDAGHFYTPLPKDLTVWNVADVRAWLSEIEMSHVSPQFVENSIDGAMPATLTDEDLQGSLGLSVLQTRKVRRELANLNQ